ncbi:MAG: LPXTG cell wall anchor domain-containing protein, partial [Lachnospiraceae bacterium]|nr:LPXTG cell wall anchor domain-containing protein [Lachnospiraceae bacterium]
MKIKKLVAAALAAGVCLMSTVVPVKANVIDKDGISVNQATFTVSDFYDSDKDVTEVKSFTVVLKCDTELSASNAFNSQIVVQNTVDWAWNQKTFSADTSVVDWQGNPYDYELKVIDSSTAEVTVPCEGVMALLTLDDRIVVGDYNAYTWTVEDVRFNFGEEPTTSGDDTPSAEEPTTSGDAAPALPKTGLVSGMVFFAAGALLTGAGVVVAKGK